MAKIFIPKKQNNTIKRFAPIIVQLCRADVEFCELRVFWYSTEDDEQSLAFATGSYSDVLKGNLTAWHLDMIRNRLAWLHCQVDCLSDEIYRSYDDQHPEESLSEMATFEVSPLLDKLNLGRNVAWLRLKIANLTNIVWSDEDSQEHLREVSMQFSQMVGESTIQQSSVQLLSLTDGKVIMKSSSGSGASKSSSNHEIQERLNDILQEEETLETVEQELLRSLEQEGKFGLVDEGDLSKKIEEILRDNLFSPIQLLEKMKVEGQDPTSVAKEQTLIYIGQRKEILLAEKRKLRATLQSIPYE